MQEYYYFLVIDVPDSSFLKSLAESKAFTAYQNKDEDNRLELILHFSPEEIVHSDEYKAFMSKFPSRTRHWFLNRRNK